MADKVYTSPMIGQGVTLAAGTAAVALSPTVAPTEAVDLAWIVDIKTGFAVGEKEWENLAQDAKRRMPTIFDGDHISGSLNYLPGDTSNKTLWGLFKAKTIVVWLITLPDTSQIAFNGFVSKLAPAVEGVEEEIDADFEIAVDGDVEVYPVVGP